MHKLKTSLSNPNWYFCCRILQYLPNPQILTQQRYLCTRTKWVMLGTSRSRQTICAFDPAREALRRKGMWSGVDIRPGLGNSHWQWRMPKPPTLHDWSEPDSSDTNPKSLLRAVSSKPEFYLSRIILQNISYSSAPVHHNASLRTRGAVAGTAVHPLCTTGGAQWDSGEYRAGSNCGR